MTDRADALAGLNESAVPVEWLPRVRKWWAEQMEETARAHGDEWPKHRDWIADYLNAEIRERVQRSGR